MYLKAWLKVVVRIWDFLILTYVIKFVNKLKYRANIKACSNEANMLVQHHPTLLDATSWPRLNTMLEDVGLISNLLKISSNIMQHCWANNVA